MVPLNDTEIAIMGGHDVTNSFGDVFLFNTNTSKCQKVADGKDRKFLTYSNQCAQAGNNTVIALVSLLNFEADEKPAVISWRKGASSVSILKTYD